MNKSGHYFSLQIIIKKKVKFIDNIGIERHTVKKKMKVRNKEKEKVKEKERKREREREREKRELKRENEIESKRDGVRKRKSSPAEKQFSLHFRQR